MIEVEHHGDVVLLRMRNGENRFNRDSVDALDEALGRAEATDGPLALVTTGEGKFFSNGLDLDWIVASGEAASGFIDEVGRLLLRVLDFPAITVAAVNGHAYAAGAMLASAHDYVVMREDRGYWCLPEVDIGLPLTEVMYHTVAAHVPKRTLRDAMLTGRRYTAAEAFEAQIIDGVAAEADVVTRAIELAQTMAAKDRAIVAEHKRLLYGRG